MKDKATFLFGVIRLLRMSFPPTQNTFCWPLASWRGTKSQMREDVPTSSAFVQFCLGFSKLSTDSSKAMDAQWGSEFGQNRDNASLL